MYSATILAMTNNLYDPFRPMTSKHVTKTPDFHLAITAPPDAYPATFQLFSLTIIIILAGFLLLFYAIHTLYKELCQKSRFQQNQFQGKENLCESQTDESDVSLFDEESSDDEINDNYKPAKQPTFYGAIV
uniref:4.1m domain-containing protein n=1 Tax=Panagrellus redivivus TaxID=6233 RepID=A0A7E4ZQ90_PANRE